MSTKIQIKSLGEVFTRLPNSKGKILLPAHLVTEHQITEEYKSLEKILQEEGCLPEGVNVPIGVEANERKRTATIFRHIITAYPIIITYSKKNNIVR